MSLLQTYYWVCQWKNNENQLIFGEVMRKSWLFCFFDSWCIQATHTHTQRPLVRDNPGRPVPEETLTHSHPSWSSDILYQLPPFTTINGILFVHFTSLTVLSYNLSPGPLWSSSWSWTHNFILHTFLHLIIIFFSQHMPIPTQPILLQYQCYLHLVSLSAPYLGAGLLA